MAAAIGIVFTGSTLYVLWAIRDLPDPTQDVLAAGDVIVLDRNGTLIEDWNPAGHYHINVSLHVMGPNPPAADSHLDPGLSTAIGGSDVTLAEHVQGYQTFANQGQRVDLSVIREVDDASGKSIYSHGNPNGTAVLTPAEAYMITGVLKDYQNQWGFGWNRQMASKTGTSDNGRGGITPT